MEEREIVRKEKSEIEKRKKMEQRELKSRENQKRIEQNKINLLITAHQFIKEGVTTYNNDRLLTVFSATNYMNQYENVGGMITIQKKNAYKRMNILPKLITFNKSKEDSFRRNNSPSPIRINNN